MKLRFDRHHVYAMKRAILFFTCLSVIALLIGTVYASPSVGPVLTENAIIGTLGNDLSGHDGIYPLPNGNIVIVSTSWNNGRGAVTCLTSAEYQAGGIVISAANSLVGSTDADRVGANGVTVLNNSSYVVRSSEWNGLRGAATWVNGSTCVPAGEASPGAAVSATNSLVGSAVGDRVSQEGVVALNNGHYVVVSRLWDNGAVNSVGAVTWGNGTTGIVGTISAANSLIGPDSSTLAGSGGVVALTNGNYVVSSPSWDDVGIVNAGAVTWGDGDGGTVGAISAANSLVGSTADDNVGNGGIFALSNGHYVAVSRTWDNGAVNQAGAVTWGDGAGGTVGVVSAANSLIGSTALDQVGKGGITALNNGNYVVASPDWDNGGAANAGAATWGDGDGGTVGVVSAANSLVGSTAGDQVSIPGITALTNDNYVVASYQWDNGGATNAGAATWGNGASGVVGTISASNSLVGSTTNNNVGEGGITPLSNGHYAVVSPNWDNAGLIEAGAVTWGNGTTGRVGTVSVSNSLVGGTAFSQVGSGGVTALNNGHYVVVSPGWNNGAADNAGAVTWGNGTTGRTGTVSASNSLVGSNNDDQVGSGGVTVLSNNHYVIMSRLWNNGGIVDAGAATWGNGASGTVGVVSAANSLVGTNAADQVSIGGVVALTNGHYIVSSYFWNDGATADVGAATWGNGGGGTVGAVSTANSLIGSTVGDSVSSGGVAALTNGNYVVASHSWDDGAVTDAGAATWGDGAAGVFGAVSAINSLIGTTAEDLIGSGDLVNNEGIVTLNDGHYLVVSPFWDNGGAADAGAVVWSFGTPPNTTPELAEIGDRTGYVEKPLSFVASATDADLPAQTLTFSLEAGAPDGATIDPVSGLFLWEIDETVTPGDYPVTITVTDDGGPNLSDSETISVSVLQINYVNNYGFENKGATNKTAAGWKTVKTAKTDQRVCNTPVKLFAFEGQCAYRFQLNGQSQPPRTIQRKTSSTAFIKDDVLELRGMVKANKLKAGARLVLKVTYNNKKQDVAEAVLTPGTYNYKPFSTQLTLLRVPAKILVQVKGGKAKGTFFIDDVAVVKVPPAPLTTADSIVPPRELRGSN